MAQISLRDSHTSQGLYTEFSSWGWHSGIGVLRQQVRGDKKMGRKWEFVKKMDFRAMEQGHRPESRLAVPPAVTVTLLDSFSLALSQLRGLPLPCTKVTIRSDNTVLIRSWENGWMSRLLASIWPNPGHCGHLGSKSADGRSLSVLTSLSSFPINIYFFF